MMGPQGDQAARHGGDLEDPRRDGHSVRLLADARSDGPQHLLRLLVCRASDPGGAAAGFARDDGEVPARLRPPGVNRRAYDV